MVELAATRNGTIAGICAALTLHLELEQDEEVIRTVLRMMAVV